MHFLYVRVQVPNKLGLRLSTEQGGTPCVLSPGNLWESLLPCHHTCSSVPALARLLFLLIPALGGISCQDPAVGWPSHKAVGGGRFGKSRQWILWNEGAGERWGEREEGPHFSVSASGAASGSCVALHMFWVLNSSRGGFYYIFRLIAIADFPIENLPYFVLCWAFAPYSLSFWQRLWAL